MEILQKENEKMNDQQQPFFFLACMCVCVCIEKNMIPSHAWPATFVVFSAAAVAAFFEPSHALCAKSFDLSAVFLANFDVLSKAEAVVCFVVSAAPATAAAVLSANVLVIFSVLSATEAAVSFVDFHAASPVFNSLSNEIQNDW